MSRDVIEMRKINYKDITYVRVEDIVYFFQSLAETEETDTRNRILRACDNISCLMD